jgi:hypothetical protein
MAVFVPPPDAPESVRRILDLLDRDIEESFADLGTKQQNDFWTDLHGYAMARKEGRVRRAALVASDRVDGAVRRLLEEVDLRLAKQLPELNEGGRRRFWTVLEEFAEQQMQATKQAAGGLRRHSSS